MSLSQTAEINQEAVGYHYARRLFFLFAALAILSLLISLAERLVGARIALGGHSDRALLHEIVIDNDILSVPQNMIRLPEQRRSGAASRLDLYLSWPALEGYNAAESAVFNGGAAEPGLIFLSFEERAMSRDMSGRFEPIYKFLIEGNGSDGPAGLTRYALQAKAGYLNEALYAGPQAENGKRFVARCIEEGAEKLVAACERDIQVGANLSATLRFPPHLLQDWRALDAAMPIFIGRLLKTSADLRGN